MSNTPKLTPQEIVWAYCENEMTYGYSCGTEGCPHCGGPEHAAETAAFWGKYHNNRAERSKHGQADKAAKEDAR